MGKKIGIKKIGSVIFIICLALLIAAAVVTGINKFYKTDFESLSQTDQSMLTELNSCIKADEEKPMWTGFNLRTRTIAAINGSWGKGYLINPSEPVKSLFAQEITMPQDYSIKVYRISPVAPQMLQFRGLANFNQSHKDYSLWGDDVFFTKYDEGALTKNKYDSGHYITFLAHESFHHYMQKEWKGGGRFLTDDLTSDDLKLLEKEYQVLADLQDEMIKEKPDHEQLKQSLKKYIAIKEKRLASKKEYVENEMMAETAEGTAMYIGVLASEAAGYDYGVMCLAGKEKAEKDVSFNVVIPTIQSGAMDPSTLSSDWCYQSGALLCTVLEELNVPGWQDKLNQQTKSKQVTLYSLIRDYEKDSL